MLKTQCENQKNFNIQYLFISFAFLTHFQKYRENVHRENYFSKSIRHWRDYQTVNLGQDKEY